MATLVISEKANAADRIAYFLSDGNKETKRVGRVRLHTFKWHGEDFVVVGLRGHVVALDYAKEMNNWHSTDLKELIWCEPSKKVTEQGIANILTSQRVSHIIIATDFDREGELIGVEALEIMARDPSKAKRARFSALTGEEIRNAFTNLVDVDVPLANAGMARQYIDLAWGAVLTRFMSLTSGMVGKDFLSVGRVQSPTLALVVDREREIESFVPVPYWEVSASLAKDVKDVKAEHVKNPFWEEPEATNASEKAKGAENAIVKSIEKEEEKLRPPVPFNTTMFISEATKLGLGARQAMNIAEELYMGGWISYPRTDNTVYPRSLSLKGVLTKLSKGMFSKECKELLSQDRIRATRGRTETTDHPPIYPVKGAKKDDLKGMKLKIYELVARRFMATVAPDAFLDITKIVFDLNTEEFGTNGRVFTSRGWTKYYPYRKVKEVVVPELSKNEALEIKRVNKSRKETRPPPRYNQGYIIQEMEKLNLGTKSTRHEIIQKLFDRGYISKPLVPTATGMALVDTLRETAADIAHPDMTATLEEEMDSIAQGDKELQEVVEDSRKMLEKVLADLQDNKKSVRNTMSKAREEETKVGKCPLCGGDLNVIKPGRKRFVGCSNYPGCKNTYPLPPQGGVVATDMICKTCGDPIVKILSKGRRPWEICLNINCPSKAKAKDKKKGSKSKPKGGK